MYACRAQKGSHTAMNIPVPEPVSDMNLDTIAPRQKGAEGFQSANNIRAPEPLRETSSELFES